MRRTILAIALLALALPAAALAKGASQVSISGPGIDKAIVIKNTARTPLDDLAVQTGFFAAVFGQSPDPMLPSRPQGALGARYRMTWTMPGPNNETDLIRQDVYPYAQGGAVTYMRSGQPFFTTERTRGGWYRGGTELRRTLSGLLTRHPPKSPAKLTATPATEEASGRDWTTALVLAAVASGLLALLAAGIVLRRRTHPAPAA